MGNIILSYKELRQIKDSLPKGSMRVIADRLNVKENLVRSFFRAERVECLGVYMEAGPDGGLLLIDNSKILDAAFEILRTMNDSTQIEMK